jgi:hypothetical protein
LENIHARRSDEPRNEQVGGTMIQIEWRADLFYAAGRENNDPVR